MISSRRFQVFFLALGDFLLFYLSLYLTLAIRYQSFVTEKVWSIHQVPFFYIHILWLLIFYIGGLYDIKSFVSYKKIFGQLIKTMAAASAIAVAIFYLVPNIEVAPKTNLFIDVFVLTMLLILWRRLFWELAGKFSKIKTLFFGISDEVEQFAKTLTHNPQFGYEPTAVLKSINHDFIDLIKQNNIQLIVASKDTMRDKETAKKFYEALPLGISVVDFESFYESLAERIPVYLVNESWFLENLLEINKKMFEKFKRSADVLGAIILGIPTLLILPFVSLLVITESAGPVFYKHKRVGKNEKIFEIIKFRTMVHDAEQNGAEWAKEKDSRITKIGGLLRKTRLDELPQLWNILKGEMSFIGPRPERPEFVEMLEKEIPHYRMRHLVKPGLSGWAQVKFPYGASVEDAMEKLQYDLYYIKNRSLVLDLAIAAKTITTMINRKGR